MSTAMRGPVLHDTAKESAYRRAEPFISILRRYARGLTQQQLRTLKGQALAGDIDGAEKGLYTILQRKRRTE